MQLRESKIDRMGRFVIPAEVRQEGGLEFGDTVQVRVLGDGWVCIRPANLISTNRVLKLIGTELRVLGETLSKDVLVCNRNCVVAAHTAGAQYIGLDISSQLKQMIIRQENAAGTPGSTIIPLRIIDSQAFMVRSFRWGSDLGALVVLNYPDGPMTQSQNCFSMVEDIADKLEQQGR